MTDRGVGTPFPTQHTTWSQPPYGRPHQGCDVSGARSRCRDTISLCGCRGSARARVLSGITRKSTWTGATWHLPYRFKVFHGQRWCTSCVFYCSAADRKASPKKNEGNAQRLPPGSPETMRPDSPRDSRRRTEALPCTSMCKAETYKASHAHAQASAESAEYQTQLRDTETSTLLSPMFSPINTCSDNLKKMLA